MGGSQWFSTTLRISWTQRKGVTLGPCHEKRTDEPVLSQTSLPVRNPVSDPWVMVIDFTLAPAPSHTDAHRENWVPTLALPCLASA
jgi:hypothetical protein